MYRKTPYLRHGLKGTNLYGYMGQVALLQDQNISKTKTFQDFKHAMIYLRPLKSFQRAIPTWRLWYKWRYNPRTTADCTADHPVGMVYLLGNWATDRWAIARRSPGDRRHRPTGDHRLISSMFDISLPTSRQAMTVARQLVGVFVNRLVGMGLKITVGNPSSLDG